MNLSENRKLCGIWTYPILTSLSCSLGSPAPWQPRKPTGSNSWFNSAAWQLPEKQNRVGTPPKPHSQKFSLLSFTAVPRKMPLLCWSLFDLTQSMPSASNLFPRWHLSKTNRTNCLALHLPGTVVRFGVNYTLIKQNVGESQNEKLGNKISMKWFWKCLCVLKKDLRLS